MLYKWLPIQSSKHKWAPKTYTHTVAMIQNLVVPYLGKKQIQKVQTYDLEQFYATLSRTPRGLYKQGVKQTLTDKQKRQFLTGASIREVHAMLKTAFSYAVEWGLLLKSPIPREAPKSTSEERAIWDEKTMLAALQTMTDPTLHLAVHLSMILSLRVGEILGLQPGDIDFDAADGRGTITVGRSLQRTEKAALEKTDPNQIYHIFPDQREGSSSALVLKKPKTKKSSRTLYLTRPLKEELLAWLEKLRQDELAMDGRYRNCGQLFRLPNGMPVAPEALSKWYRAWRAEHPEFEKIVFHGLRHSSATYQLIESGGNIKAVQGNTGHATTGILMDTYAHTQDKPRLELAEKLEADFYSQDIGSPKSGSVPVKENLPDSIQITPEGQIYHIFPDQREGSSSALVLKKPKTKKSSRTLYLTRPLKDELLAWLEKLRQDELAMDGRYRNCGQLFRLPNGMPVAPEALSKWYRTWRAEHPEFEKIVFHGLRHSSATYQLIESGGNIKAVQGNTGHATTGILMDTYAHTQDKPRLELAEKLEADFYSQDIGSPKSGSVPVKENLPDSIQITPEGMLKVVRQMNPEQRREFTRLLFA
ncbi:site-specific integrase [Faecalibacterium prausnitzii]